MKLLLPDQSTVYFNPETFEFKDHPISKDSGQYDVIQNFNISRFQQYLERPTQPFSSCFRRQNNTPMYSPVTSSYYFNITLPADLFELEKLYGYGGMFSSSEVHYAFLDGKIIIYEGYGWGNRSWTAIEGYEVLRLVCLFQGIKQPVRIKGEKEKGKLSDILLKLSGYKINKRFFGSWANPWNE